LSSRNEVAIRPNPLGYGRIVTSTHQRTALDHLRQVRTPRTAGRTTNAHPDAEPVQIVFDFTMDLAELEAADEAA
jgi:hypothetical protein